MNKYGKVLSGAALGAVIGLSSLSSAFAAQLQSTYSKNVTFQQTNCITQETAKTIALKEQTGTVKSVNLTEENGVDIYVVVIQAKDGNYYDVKLDAKTGSLKQGAFLSLKIYTNYDTFQK